MERHPLKMYTIVRMPISIFDIHVKQKISFINEMKQDEILIKPNILDWEKLHSILWTFIKFRDIVCPTFIYFQWHEWKL